MKDAVIQLITALLGGIGFGLLFGMHRRHILPAALGGVLAWAIYLGIVKLGSSSMTSLGTLLADASTIWTNYPHLMILPALFISLLMISFNLFGNGLRDAFNPSLRNVED